MRKLLFNFNCLRYEKFCGKIRVLEINSNFWTKKGCIIMSRQKGFTLIELLMVIGIIALLMAILIPTLNRAKEQAKNMVCTSNLRQYALAGTMYLDDNDDYFANPHRFLFGEAFAAASPCNWCDEKRWNDAIRDKRMGPMWPYLKDKDVHLCPTFKGLAKHWGQAVCRDTTIDIKPQYGYGQNGWLGRPADADIGAGWYTDAHGGTPTWVEKKSDVKKAADTFFFSEENMWKIEGMNAAVLNDTALFIRSDADDGDCLATFHNPPNTGLDVDQQGWGEGGLCEGSANVVFIDGHAEMVHVGVENREDGCKLAFPKGYRP